ncbi:MAG TPA: anthranilate synthase component I [Cytophagales bacterium]|nr:anthranilate synthase component I [Cytophagales bacterium]HAA18814.1 anthranilate synthase component I [Cytophagales bacterium]HAP64356.1 anthranilate synthase component I [Cytophagales bacterium]
MLADTVTPVSIYLKLRDRYRNPILLESSDYHGNEDAFSFICCNPIASFTLTKDSLTRSYPDGARDTVTLEKGAVVNALSEFAAAFVPHGKEFKFTNNGLFGYTAYPAVQHFEDLELNHISEADEDIPLIRYDVFQYVIAVDHFKNELYIFQHGVKEDASASGLDDIAALINNRNLPGYRFSRTGEESSNFTDDEFLEVVQHGIDHCHRGDVFQIVLSRRYQTPFKGDEFNVYRALRSINPSPYLYYFDYGNFKIMGSSPEAQLVVRGKKATIYPIAGTFLRTGNDEADRALAEKLSADPKENSEHVMLVDLARNDLSRHGDNVEVETFKEVQYFSHVIHLVSKVTGELSDDVSSFQMVADTFPAGTLSGAPKVMAMTLIDKYENRARGYYGGAIGYLGFNGDFNHAIMIRSFLSQAGTLHYQAGAGVVAKSKPENERQEVNNKLAALRQALDMAETL